MLLVLAGCDWSQYGFDAGHSGWNPTEHTITPANVGTLTARWTGVGVQPVVGRGLVFSNSAGALAAHDATTGALRWKRPAGPSENGGFGGPAVWGDTVYVTASHGVSPSDVSTTLHALDTATGTDRWSVVLTDCPQTLFSAGAPTVSDGLVIVADEINKVCALDAKTGAKVWSVTLPGVHASLKTLVAIGGGRVFAYGWTSLNGVTVFALDEHTGAALWSHDAAGYPWGAPVVSAGRLFIPARVLSTFDPATGAPGWTDNTFETRHVAVTGDAVVATGPGAIRRLDPSTGTPAWAIAGPPTIHYGVPAIANGMVFVWSFIDTGSRDSTQFCCAHLSALDLRTGGQLFSLPTQQAVNQLDVLTRYPVVSGGSVYFGEVANGVPDGSALRPSGS
jgi:outer membrane protein assembly factor BamB